MSPGRAAEIWYGAGALWDPRALVEGSEAKICGDQQAIEKASRAAGIGMKSDDRRSRCAGKTSTVLKVDHSDQTAFLRVFVTPRSADELWFGIAAIEPLVN